MEVNFLYISEDLKQYTLFEGVDLADLVTLIDWGKPIDIKDIEKAIKGNKFTVKNKLNTKDLDTFVAEVEAYLKRQVDYFAVQGSRRPPVKKKSNLLVIQVIDASDDEEWKIAFGVLNTQTKGIRLGTDWARTVPFPFLPKLMSRGRALSVLGGEHEGLYVKGRKI